MATGDGFGPWLLDKRLAVGGMGEVWLASHRVLGRRVAVKILSPELTLDPRFRERFISEAQVQARLTHPHIAQIQDFIEEDGRFAILMEWIPGGTLAGALERAKGPLSVEQTLKWTRQALEGLDHAHRQGVIHRDVKPSNLMLDASWDIKVTDFGIAVAIGVRRLTITGRMVGTPQYMSPEQILRPQAVDHRTDVYSMGVVMYEMLAGRVPFDADTDYTLQKLHIEAPPPSLRELNPLVPEWLESIVLRCLAKSPDDRFPGCAAAAAALYPRPSASMTRIEFLPERHFEPTPAPTPPPSPTPHIPPAPPTPVKASVEKPPTPAPYVRPEPEPARSSKRPMALATFACIAAVALALAWWFMKNKAPDVSATPPAAAAQAEAAPAPVAVTTPPTRATAPPPHDAEVDKLRSSIMAAIRARAWSKAAPQIDSLLAKLPSDAEAQAWRKLLAAGRNSDLDVTRAEEALQQGEYDSAIALFQRALTVDAGNERAQNGLKQAENAKSVENSVFGGGR